MDTSNGVLTAARIAGIVGLIALLRQLGMPSSWAPYAGPAIGLAIGVVYALHPADASLIDAILALGAAAVGAHTMASKAGGGAAPHGEPEPAVDATSLLKA